MKKFSALLIVLSLILSLAFGSLSAFADDTDPAATPVPETEQEYEGGGEDDNTPDTPEEVPGEVSEPGDPEQEADPEESGPSGQEDEPSPTVVPEQPAEPGTDPAEPAQEEDKDDSGNKADDGEEQDPETPEETVPEKTEKEEPKTDKEKKSGSGKVLDDAAGATIVTQPKDQEVSYPKGASFSVEVKEPEGVTYQWFCDGDVKLQGKTAKSATLELPATHPDDTGHKFHCEITDKNGKVVKSDAAELIINNADEEKTVLYVGVYAIEPDGKTFDLSKTELGSGKITFNKNGKDITFDKVNFDNEKFAKSEHTPAVVGISLYSSSKKDEKINLTLKGKNVIKNAYYNEKTKNGGNTLEFVFDGEDVKSSVTIKGTGSLAIEGGSNGLLCEGALTIESETSVKLKAKGKLAGIVSSGKLTVKDANITVKAEEKTGEEESYGILCKDSEISLAEGYKVKCEVETGTAFASYTGEDGKTKKGYESGYAAKHITLADKTACVEPEQNAVALTSIPMEDEKYAYCETFYDLEDPTEPATEVEFKQEKEPVTPVYTFDSSSDTRWLKGSVEGLKATVNREPDNSEAFDHFTGIEVDGNTVPKDYYTAESGSVKLEIGTNYLETLAAGQHTMKMLFDDGSADTEFDVQEQIIINIRGNITTAAYNGEEQYAKGCRASSESSLFDLSKLAFAPGKSALAAGTDVGTYQMGLEPEYFVYNDESVSAVIQVTDGYVEITPATLAVTTGSASKVYDGQPLTSNEVKVEGLAKDEKVTITTTGTQTQVGTSQNTFTITWDTAKESNYTLTQTLGTLTVRASGSGGGGGNGGGTSGGNGSRTNGNVVTGDNSNMALWIVLIIAAGLAAAFGTVIYRRRK